MPRVQLTESKIDMAELRGPVSWQPLSDRLTGDPSAPTPARVIVDGRPGFRPFRCRPLLDKDALSKGQSDLETTFVQMDLRSDELRRVALGSRFTVTTIADVGLSELLGTGIVSGLTERDRWGYAADFLLEDVSCAPGVLETFEGHTLRFDFHGCDESMDGHWSGMAYESRADDPDYPNRYWPSDRPWANPVPDRAVWVCLHDMEYGDRDFVKASLPLADGDAVTVSDESGVILKGRVGSSSHFLPKPVLAYPKPFLDPGVGPASTSPK